MQAELVEILAAAREAGTALRELAAAAANPQPQAGSAAPPSIPPRGKGCAGEDVEGLHAGHVEILFSAGEFSDVKDLKDFLRLIRCKLEDDHEAAVAAAARQNRQLWAGLALVAVGVFVAEKWWSKRR
jgi:hypothetical protein